MASSPSLPISSVSDATSTATDVSEIEVGNGLEIGATSAGYAFIQPVFVGTGAANSVARSDHTHTTPSFVSVPYAATGSLSSGSRLLAQTSPTLADGITYLVKLRLHSTVRANGSESSYYTLFLNIDSGAATSTSQIYQSVGFVPAPQTFEFGATVVGDGTARLMSASITYSSGVPALVDAGQLVVDLFPAR